MQYSLPEMPVILNYAELSSNLLISGQMKRIVSWDLLRETRLPDIQTQTDGMTPLTAMTTFDR